MFVFIFGHDDLLRLVHNLNKTNAVYPLHINRAVVLYFLIQKEFTHMHNMYT